MTVTGRASGAKGAAAGVWMITVCAFLAGTSKVVEASVELCLDQLMKELKGHALAVGRQGRRLLVTMSVCATPDLPFGESMERVRVALSRCGFEADELEVLSATPRTEIAEAIAVGAEPHLWSSTDVAARLGISRQRVHTMMQTGKLPHADCFVGRAAGFERARIEAFAREREESRDSGGDG